MQLSIITPEKTLFSSEAQMVTIPGTEGEFGVLAGHAPFMTALKSGPLVVHNNGAKTIYEVEGGFADVTPAGLTVLAEKAQLAQ